MSYRRDIEKEITSLIDNKEKRPEKIAAAVETVFAKAIEESRLAGLSIESTGYEILEGIKEGLHGSEEDINEVLGYAIELMMKTALKSAGYHIDKRQKAFQIAKERLEESRESEKAMICELMETFRAYSEENSLSDLSKYLDETGKTVNSSMDSIAGSTLENTHIPINDAHTRI